MQHTPCPTPPPARHPPDTTHLLQLVDDMLDFTGSSKTLGKPALNDLKSGLATAPVLYAAESHAELRPLILRKFEEPGDVKLAQELVFGSDGIERTRQLAVSHARKAAEMVRPCPQDCGPVLASF